MQFLPPNKVFKDFYPLVLNDGGRNFSKRPLQFNDCTVRALAIIANIPYDLAYDTLAKAGRKSCDGFDLGKWIKVRKGKFLGKTFRQDLQIQKAGYIITPFNFGNLFPKGRYLLETHNHIWVVIDGIHYDLWRAKQHICLNRIWRYK